MKKLTTLLIFFSVIIYCRADLKGTLDQKQADKVYQSLSGAKKTSDSIKILYDVYDLSNRDKRNAVGYEILNLAERDGNREVVIDILNRLASHTEDTEALSRLLEYSSNLPNDSARKGVELMIKMEEAKSNADKANPNQREKRLVELARNDLRDKDDIYESILDLYTVMVNLGISSQGSLYLEYLTRLQDLVEKLPENEFAIRNLVYSTATIYYTRRHDSQKALEASRKLLNQVDLLKKQYKSDERKYQTFDYFYYMVYRRMLENFRGMSPEEAQKLYDECVAIAERNEEVRQIFGKRGLTQSFYNMAVHNYKEAIPYLRKALSNDSLSIFRQRELWGLLVEALDSVGDRNGQFDAMKEYIRVTNEEMETRRNDAYKELQLRTDVNRLAYQERIENEKTREENRQMRKVSITLVYVLAVVIILMFGSYFRMRQKVKELSRKNIGLTSNLENIFDDGSPSGTHDPRIKRGNLKG